MYLEVPQLLIWIMYLLSKKSPFFHWEKSTSRFWGIACVNIQLLRAERPLYIRLSVCTYLFYWELKVIFHIFQIFDRHYLYIIFSSYIYMYNTFIPIYIPYFFICQGDDGPVEADGPGIRPGHVRLVAPRQEDAPQGVLHVKHCRSAIKFFFIWYLLSVDSTKICMIRPSCKWRILRHPRPLP